MTSRLSVHAAGNRALAARPAVAPCWPTPLPGSSSMRMLLSLALLACSSLAHAVQVDHLPFASGERAAQPSVTVDARDGFVLTWQERDGEHTALRFAVLDADGAEQRRGTVATGGDWFVNGADFPNLVVLDNGDWVTFFLKKTSPGTYSYAIHTVRSRDAGATWDAPVVIHRDGTDTEHGFVSLVADGEDRVRAVWLDGRHMAGGGDHAHGTSEHMTLRSAALGRDGVHRDEHELDDLTCACCQTDAVRVDGRIVVAYRDRTRDEVRDIGVLEFADDRWSAPRILHADGWVMPACPVNGPAVASDGKQVATLWPTMAGGEMRVLLTRGDAAGAPTQLASGPTELGRVDLAAWADRQWLATRVVATERVPTLWLSLLAADGSVQHEQRIAGKVGGYPRMATRAGVGLLVWAEQGETNGSSRIGLARIAP